MKIIENHWKSHSLSAHYAPAVVRTRCPLALVRRVCRRRTASQPCATEASNYIKTWNSIIMRNSFEIYGTYEQMYNLQKQLKVFSRYGAAIRVWYPVLSFHLWLFLNYRHVIEHCVKRDLCLLRNDIDLYCVDMVQLTNANYRMHASWKYLILVYFSTLLAHVTFAQHPVYFILPGFFKSSAAWILYKTCQCIWAPGP